MVKMKQHYVAYRDFLYQFFLKHVKIPELAEDFAQDVFIKFWQQRDSLHDIDNMDAWLYTLARNHLTDHYRKLATERKYQEEVWHQMERHSPGRDAYGTIPRVLLDIYKKELDDEIEALLDSLSPRQKEVYILSRKKGMSLDEIALQLNISPNTAKNHLVQALKVVRNGLDGRYVSIILLVILFLI